MVSIDVKDGLHITKDRVPALIASVRDLANLRTMVGVPDANADKGRQGDDLNNAQIAKLHDQGEPAGNIPARPFMVPGMKAADAAIQGWTRKAGEAALDGDMTRVMRAMNAAGMVAASSIQRVITAGIPPPLAPSTVKKRIARRASPAWRRKRKAEVAANVAAGVAPGAGIFTPLIDTGSLRAAITSVVRKLKG
jgi:hypothetical protein